MSAEPTGHVMWSPDPIRQRLANHYLEDVLALPDDAPRVELRDGVMIVVPSPTFGHQTIGNLLWMWFRQNAPDDMFIPGTAVGVAVGLRDSLEPDVLLLRPPVPTINHFFLPEQVAIAVEVVSPGTKRRDRFEKPSEYAAAGVSHFWRIEQDPVHVYAYDLVDGRYELAADSDTELELTMPFEIKLPIREITP
ncbi:Uma2 family endonuclease [Paractinoplanes atraurantiacus]|uniref:Endonuclease, Uma2 family (Restriction endonuclease fold) n=1 Tax=Paractinoplanes atraurantiacus TaxID=1036182 RepID=A0A285F5R7_9ACTN|nr:Uma2 family endonuclease [Actinoplanes atraurantiacus]SNY05726.1 Endonuclease, Uma2 family (restriction endonuclease fold) [Actinoplanes atraurantiacus]